VGERLRHYAASVQRYAPALNDKNVKVLRLLRGGYVYELDVLGGESNGRGGRGQETTGGGAGLETRYLNYLRARGGGGEGGGGGRVGGGVCL